MQQHSNRYLETKHLIVINLIYWLCFGLTVYFVAYNFKYIDDNEIKTIVSSYKNIIEDDDTSALAFGVIEQEDRFGKSFIKYTITNVVFISSNPKCIDGLTTFPKRSGYDDFDALSIKVEPICDRNPISPTNIDHNETILEKATINISRTLEIETGSNTFLYPYDSIIIKPNLAVSSYNPDTDSNSNKIPWTSTLTVWTVNLPQWDKYEDIREDIDINGVKENQVVGFKMQRPLIYRFLSPILLIILFLFITIIPFTRDISACAQVSVAILFGLWGTKELLIPDTLIRSNILSYGFLVLYACLAVASFLRVVVVSIFLRIPVDAILTRMTLNIVNILRTVRQSIGVSVQRRAERRLLKQLILTNDEDNS